MSQDARRTARRPRAPAKPRCLNVAIFLISGAGLAYELVLMRVFSIAQWHHFAYMIISIAMLGFGASGTVLAIFRSRLEGRENAALRISATLFTIGMPGCYILSQRIPFETFELVTQPGQIWNLLGLYLVLSAPFFLVSTCVTLAFFLAPRDVGRVYFFNMAGSGLGALAVVLLLYVTHPGTVPYLLAAVSAVALMLLLLDLASWPARLAAGLLLVAAVLGAVRPSPIRVSQYKGLSYTLQLPDAEVLGEWCSPMSVVTAVSSSQIRETPGQISNYPMDTLGYLPEQVGLYFDAGGVSAVNRFDGDLEPFAYLDYVTSALPYRLIGNPNVLVIGPGGGTDVLSALYHTASHVTAVEVDPSVFTILRGELGEFSGRLYDHPDVTTVLGEGRGFLEAHDAKYDLIQVPLLGSFTASSAGVHALNESYFYTKEAVRLHLSHLTDNGVLAITVWLKSPPRDALKMFATVVEACEEFGMDEPERHLAFIRSWNNATIVVSRSPLTTAQIGVVRGFSDDRMVDLCYCPGIQPDEPNRYTLLERPVYYEFARDVLSPEKRDGLYRNALFYDRPATDDRPYFFRFLKWSSLPRLIKGLGTEWIPFVEWGYLTLVATILQGIVTSAVLILLPLIVLARVKRSRGAKRWVVLYFAGLGFAYMFLEIAFIQRFMLFLTYPIYTVTVVLTAFLLFSGLGSLFAARFQRRNRLVTVAVAAIVLLGALYLIVLPSAFTAWAGWPDRARIAVSIALLSPLAFCMGIPFPSGLQIVSDEHAPLLPWAWGINGCASVTGATLATLTAVHLGFRILVLLALLLYLTTVLSLRRLAEK